MTAKVKRSAPGDNCTQGHDRSKGVRTFRDAMNAAEGDESRVVPCFQCEKYFVAERR